MSDTNDDTASTVTELFSGSQQVFAAHEPATLLGSGNPAYRALGGWFQVGGDDGQPLAAAQQLVPLAQKAGITTCLVVVPDAGHTFDVWSAAFSSSLPWMAGRFGLVPPTQTTTASCQNPA